ncbi:PEP-CTERM sorting domain-containing protein [Roseisolibacter sp. H3M3-2]|uniref:PEP-CTERM sorting domain-containing protein n=1 Tax=Roseisolibacter sp. H3M3-2 TaxID=3031323 RepID=UPI0023DC2D99|nr:PEP-CTERM sorting domain-containing protein [Roseisolibacter sp. H3M3-2]MDF1506068.1 PEP-CTERM sorting domain-containing protein [Roseisolibacter sp. H3M3-2]
MRPTVFLSSAAAALLALAAPPAAEAQQVATRADLAAILGATARTETFDDVTDPARGVYAATTHGTTPGAGLPLTGETVLRDRGAGLIEPGLAFSNANNGHWFWPAGWGSYGNASTVYSGSHATQDVAFTTPTRAFGLDLYVFASQPIGTTISVFDLAGALVGSATLTPTAGQFFGWRHDAGIGRVRLQGGTNDAAGIRMDDVTFGAGPAATTTAPEPATVTLVGAGLALVAAARRRARRA